MAQEHDSSSESPLHIEQFLDGLPFPAAKVQLITYADEQGASEEVLEILRALPIGSYNNIQEIYRVIGLLAEEEGQENLWSSADMERPEPMPRVYRKLES